MPLSHSATQPLSHSMKYEWLLMANWARVKLGRGLQVIRKNPIVLLGNLTAGAVFVGWWRKVEGCVGNGEEVLDSNVRGEERLREEVG